MKGEDLLQAMGDIPEEELERCEKTMTEHAADSFRSEPTLTSEKQKKKIRPLRFLGTAAACLACFLIGLGAASGFRLGAFKSTSTSASESYYAAAPYEGAAEMALDGDYAYEGAYAETAAETMAGDTANGGYNNGISGDASAESAQTTSRKLITTASYTVETENYEDLTSWIQNKTAALGGYIQNSDSSVSYNDLRYANYTIRIPAENLNSFTDALAEESNVRNSNISVSDITLQYVDTASHISSLKTEQERLNDLLAQADNVSDMLEIEDALTNVRYLLEYYESAMRTYDDQINYSTLYLDVNEVKKYSEPEPESFLERISTGFSDNLEALSEGLVDFTVDLISFLPTIALLAVILVIIFAVIRAILRKKKK